MQDLGPPLQFFGIVPPDPSDLNTMIPSAVGVLLADPRGYVDEVFEGSKPLDTQASRRSKPQRLDCSGLGDGERLLERAVREEVGLEDV